MKANICAVLAFALLTGRSLCQTADLPETVSVLNASGQVTNVPLSVLAAANAPGAATNDYPSVQPEIRTDAGGAVADHGLLKVRFTPNAAESRPVTISRGGRTVSFRPTYIALVKRTTGEAWIVGQVTNSVLEVSSSEVTWREAFDPVSADIKYAHAANGSRLEQFITIREKIVLPKELEDCEADVDLECWTEFFLESDPVSVQETPVLLREAQPGLAAVEAVDQSTDLGSVKIPGGGKAFGVGEEEETVPVAKTWIGVQPADVAAAQDQRPRRFLCERADWLSIKPKLDKLPKPSGHASINFRKTSRNLLARLAPPAVHGVGSAALVLLARSGRPAISGVVIDFAVVAPEGLLAWWKADGDTLDSAGDFDGTAEGGMGYAAGKVGQGFNLDGSDDWVSVNSAATLNFGPGADFSIEGWIKPIYAVTTYGLQMILDKRETTAYDTGAVGYALYVVNTPSGAQLGCQITEGPLPPQDYHYHSYGPVGVIPVDNNCHHVALTADRDTSITLYLDGDLVQSWAPADGAGDLSNGGPLRIGKHASSGVNAPFKGIIDELSLYSRALSQAEIQSIFNAGPDGKALPPTITTRPASQSVAPGANATFTVVATGTAPLGYQWRLNGANIAGATGTSYIRSNVQLADQGNYSVVVSNPGGSATSADAILTVSGGGACAFLHYGLLSWWRAEGDATDATGLNPGTLMNGAGFGVGEVGQGFSLSGASRYVRVPSSASLRLAQEFTIECWYKDTASTWYYGLIAKRSNVSPYTTTYGINICPNSVVQLYFLDPTYVNFQICDYSPAPAASVFHHVAGTFRQTDSAHVEVKLYIDGACVKTVTKPGNLANCQNDVPVTLGASIEGGEYLVGVIDEASLYNRALSDREILGLYSAGSAGKCTDADADGLPDAWEMRYFGNLLQTPTGDYDSDGLTNLQEYQLSTSPVLADTGATGTTDGYKDADNDGLTNLEEFSLGTDPLRPNVAAPAFGPVGGSYSSARSVTMTCPTTGATIHYTLNGAEPTEASPSYSAPVLVDHSLTLKANAWKSGWITSDTETESFRIEDPPSNQAPAVTLLPPSGSAVLASDTVELLAEAEDSDGTISKLQLFHGNFKVAEATSSPLRYTLPSLPAGAYTFTAKAIDDAGAVTTSAPTTITVNASGPAVSLAGIQPFFTSSPGTIVASIVGVNPGALTSLTLNGSPLPPRGGQFSLTVSLVEGENTFTLAATDNQSRTAQATTKVYLDSILPVISITAPANNSSFSTTRINVTGTFTETSLNQIAVNGVLAFISGNTFEALNVPLAEGANAITATAEDLSGNVRSATINVTGIAPLVDPVQLTATPVGGFAPLQVTLTPQSASPGTLQQVLYDFNGDNIVDQTAANLNPINHTYSAPGEYFPVVMLVTTSGRFSSLGGWNAGLSRTRINVQAPPVQVGTAIPVTDPVDLRWVAGRKLYVLSRSTSTITEYDVSQTPAAIVRSISAIGTTPTGLDVDTSGNVYVALSARNQVAKYNPTSTSFELDPSFGISGRIGRADQSAGAANGEFSSPYDVAVSPDGAELAVSDSGNHRIQVFSAGGEFTLAFGEFGTDLGQFNAPKGLAFDKLGILYVVDSGNNRVALAKVFGVIAASGATGTALGQFQGALNPGLGSRGLYVADTGNNRIQKFDPAGHGEGTPLTPLNPRLALSAELGLNQPNSVAAVEDLLEERIYVADTGNNRVVLAKLPGSPSNDPLAAWDAAKQRLLAGDIAGAIPYFASVSAGKYRDAFLSIGTTDLAANMSQIGVLTPVFIDVDGAQYRFDQVMGGLTITFLVDFVLENGTWKIIAF